MDQNWNAFSPLFLKSTAAKFPTTGKHSVLAYRNMIFTTQIQQATQPFSLLSSMYCQADSSWSTHRWNCTGNIWHSQDIPNKISFCLARWVIDDNHGNGWKQCFWCHRECVHWGQKRWLHATCPVLFQAWMEGRVICSFHGQMESRVTDDSLYFIFSSLLCV